jgi:hypothetical protein
MVAVAWLETCGAGMAETVVVTTRAKRPTRIGREKNIVKPQWLLCEGIGSEVGDCEQDIV